MKFYFIYLSIYIKERVFKYIYSKFKNIYVKFNMTILYFTEN